MMRSKKPVYFLAAALLPLLFVLQNPKITQPIHNATLTVLKPALVLSQTVTDSVVSVKDWVVRFWETFNNYEHMDARRLHLETEVLRLQESARENERLRKLLELKERSPSRSVAVRVIGRDPSPWRKTLILDKGTADGIKKDMPVVVSDGLVGRVIETGPLTARVLLLIDSDARVSALGEESRAQGVMTGNGTARLQMRYLELDGGIAVEEMVLTSGIGGLFKKGIRIGKVVSISRDPDGLHLLAQVEPFVSFSKLEEMLCLDFSPSK